MPLQPTRVVIAVAALALALPACTNHAPLASGTPSPAGTTPATAVTSHGAGTSSFAFSNLAGSDATTSAFGDYVVSGLTTSTQRSDFSIIESHERSTRSLVFSIGEKLAAKLWQLAPPPAGPAMAAMTYAESTLDQSNPSGKAWRSKSGTLVLESYDGKTASFRFDTDFEPDVASSSPGSGTFHVAGTVSCTHIEEN